MKEEKTIHTRIKEERSKERKKNIRAFDRILARRLKGLHDVLHLEMKERK